MKKLFFYIAFSFRTLYWKLLAIVLTMLALQSLMFSQAAHQSGMMSAVERVRFESLLEATSHPMLFYLAMALTLGLGGLLLIRDTMKTKSVYTLMTVPVPRAIPFAAKLLATLLGMLVVYAAELLSIVLSYGMYQSYYPEELRMHNGLYLAFMRSRFLSAVFSLSGPMLLCNLLTVICVVAAVFFGVLAIRSKRWQALLLVVWLYLCFWLMAVGNDRGIPTLLQRMYVPPAQMENLPEFFFVLVCFTVFSGLLGWLGYRIYRDCDV